MITTGMVILVVIAYYVMMVITRGSYDCLDPEVLGLGL